MVRLRKNEFGKKLYLSRFMLR